MPTHNSTSNIYETKIADTYRNVLHDELLSIYALRGQTDFPVNEQAGVNEQRSSKARNQSWKSRSTSGRQPLGTKNEAVVRLSIIDTCDLPQPGGVAPERCAN